MKKVLIVTYYWPPAGGSGVQRWLKFVKYFRNFGIEPVVYTAKNPNYPIIDESLVDEIPKDIEVIKQPIFEPNTIFSKFKKNTESAGFLNPNPSFFGRFLQNIRANFFIPDARKYWVKPSVKFLAEYLKNNEIDTIITTGPPHSLHLIGLKLKEVLNIKWIADFRDPWVEIDYFHQLPLSKKSMLKHKQLENEVLQRATAITVVGKSMKEAYKKVNSNTYVVTNGFDFEATNSVIKLDEKFTLTHIGLMNNDRNHPIFWEAISELIEVDDQLKKDLKINLVGKVASNVRHCIYKYNLNNFVKLTPYLSHTKVIEYQQKSQVLLLFVNNVPSANGIITGKIFEYLNAERPVLAIAPTQGDLAEIINKTEAGFVVDFSEKEALKKLILDLYAKFKVRNLVINSKGVSKYHRKNLTEKYASIIHNL